MMAGAVNGTVSTGDNKATVYYYNASYTNAYIHYQVDNGSWTPAEAGTYTIKALFKTFTGAIYEKQITYTVQDTPNPTITTLKADKTVGGTHTTTTFTVKATNGTAPYTYKLAIMKDGMAVNANSYFTINSNGTYQYTPLTAGNYTVYAKVIDKNGKEAVASMSYKVEGAKWGNVTATASNNKIGTPVTLKAEYLNYQSDRYNSYSFKITKNGVTNTYSADSTGTYVWTPSEAGTYTITAIFSTFTGARYEKQITYTAEAVNKNTVTIYYSTGWSKANIHYSVGNGGWTGVPGVAMTKTSERAGYTHKFVIDLGSASYATICFNDGNGSWDSRNGQNYKVYARVYGVKNGQVSKLN